MKTLLFEQWQGGHYFNYLECLIPRLAEFSHEPNGTLNMDQNEFRKILFEFDLIICELVAVITESDDPGRLGSRQFRTEFRARDHDVACGIRAAEQVHKAAAVLPDSEKQNNSGQQEASRGNPLAGTQELQHYCRGASSSVTSRVIFLLLRKTVRLTLSPGL